MTCIEIVFLLHACIEVVLDYRPRYAGTDLWSLIQNAIVIHIYNYEKFLAAVKDELRLDISDMMDPSYVMPCNSCKNGNSFTYTEMEISPRKL